MTGFRFVFPDDEDEGFESLEKDEASADDEDDDGEEEPTQINNEDEVIWETEED
jgi:hypothetical protein